MAPPPTSVTVQRTPVLAVPVTAAAKLAAAAGGSSALVGLTTTAMLVAAAVSVAGDAGEDPPQAGRPARAARARMAAVTPRVMVIVIVWLPFFFGRPNVVLRGSWSDTGSRDFLRNANNHY
jgi:hypothetical protein